MEQRCLLCSCSLIVRTAFQWNVAIGLRTDWWWNIAFFGFVEGSHGMGKGFTKPLQNEFHRSSSVVSRLECSDPTDVFNAADWFLSFGF